MQGIMETIFDVAYLSTVIITGIIMITKSNGNKQFKLFGIMAVILGLGDSFHLIPRAYGLLTIGLEANAAALGIGKLITSVTMTVFYLILYNIWRIRYNIKDKKNLSIFIYALAVIRIALCLFPQNQWLSYNPSLAWGIYRNIPFALIGIIIIVLFFTEASKSNDKMFKYMWFAITLSFAFYVPVVLFSSVVPAVGILMIPKTAAYVWIVMMGFLDMKNQNKQIQNKKNKQKQKRK